VGAKARSPTRIKKAERRVLMLDSSVGVVVVD
jgi:hypothetical protein